MHKPSIFALGTTSISSPFMYTGVKHRSVLAKVIRSSLHFAWLAGICLRLNFLSAHVLMFGYYCARAQERSRRLWYHPHTSINRYP